MDARYIPTWILRVIQRWTVRRTSLFPLWMEVTIELWRRDAEEIAEGSDPPAHPCAPIGGVN